LALEIQGHASSLEVLKTPMEKVVSLPFRRQQEIKPTATAAACFASASLAEHRTVCPRAVFGVAGLYLCFSSGHSLAAHVEERLAALAARRSNNCSDGSWSCACSAGG